MARTLRPSEWESWLRVNVNDARVRAVVLDLLHRVESELLAQHESDNEPDAMVGARVGCWTIASTLGSGGMGRVYRGRDPAGRVAAIKVLRRELTPHALDRRWAREVRALEAAASDDVAKLLDCGVELIEGEAHHWLAIELIEPASNVADYVTEQRLDRGARIDLLLLVARAVEAAHARGIVHGDLKPSNILIDNAGRPKILDFGLARMLGASQDSTLLWGTPAFCAPEQLHPRATPTPASDVYSLGRLAELILRPPPGGADPDARSIERVITRATAIAPTQRYPNAAQFRRALDQATAHPRTNLAWATWGPLLGGLTVFLALAWAPPTPQLWIPDPIEGDNLGQNLVANGDLVVASREVARNSVVFRWDRSRYVFDGYAERPTEMLGHGFGCVATIDDGRVYLGWNTATIDGHANAGAVLGYRRTPCGWEHVETIVAEDPRTNAYFGRAVSIDGDTLVVGADLHPGAPSVASSFTNWGLLEAALREHSRHSDADISAPMRGAAYVFRREANGIWRQRQLLTRRGAIDGFQFGFAVNVAGDRLLVSNQYCSGVKRAEHGSVFVYRRTGPDADFEHVQTLTRPDRSLGTAFGWRVASRGSVVMVSAHAARTERDSYVGEVRVYDETRVSGTERVLSLRENLSPRNQEDNENFGNGIAVGVGYLAVSAPGGGWLEPEGGAIEIFVRSNDLLRESRLEATQASAGDALGCGYNNSVAATEHGVVAAAWHATVDGKLEAGALYFWPKSALGRQPTASSRP